MAFCRQKKKNNRDITQSHNCNKEKGKIFFLFIRFGKKNNFKIQICFVQKKKDTNM